MELHGRYAKAAIRGTCSTNAGTGTICDLENARDGRWKLGSDGRVLPSATLAAWQNTPPGRMDPHGMNSDWRDKSVDIVLLSDASKREDTHFAWYEVNQIWISLWFSLYWIFHDW